jgi:hypothetical protein
MQAYVTGDKSGGLESPRRIERLSPVAGPTRVTAAFDQLMRSRAGCGREPAGWISRSVLPGTRAHIRCRTG